MTLDPRTPVVVGVGQVTHRDGDAPEPVDLLAEAARRAVADCGGHDVVAAVDSVRVVRMLSRRYPDPAALVAERIGATPRHTVLAADGGHMPQMLIDRAARDIAAGAADVVLVGGAESWRTRGRYKRRGESAPWSTQADTAPSEVVGESLVLTSPYETSLGLTDPVHVYPLFETALRHRRGRTVDEHAAHVARLWAAFSEVAARNPCAAVPEARTAAELATWGPDNRPVAYPYAKLLVANSHVDQAAALLLCSVARARSLGVPQDRWVFLHAAAEGNDIPFVSERDDLSTSEAIGLVGRTAMAAAGVDADDIAHVDLYSCFPSAVQIAAEALGMDEERALTVTGGLTFSGGPWNNYVSHAVATMVGVLREDPDAFGLCTANGGMLTKHAIGVYAARPPRQGVPVVSVQDQLDRLPRVPVAERHRGRATVEAYTVLYDRDGEPHRAFVMGRTPDGARAVATSDDRVLCKELVADELCGREVAVADGRLAG